MNIEWQVFMANSVEITNSYIKCKKKLRFRHELTAKTHLKLQKLQKGDYPTSTSPKYQCAVE